MQVREYLMNEAGVQPLFFMISRDEMMVSFMDSADSKKCKEKIECLDDIVSKNVMKKWNLDHWDLKFKSKWITMNGLKENTTRQQIVDYIKKNGKIKVKEKDIYMERSPFDFFAIIECRSNSDAQKLVQTQKLSKLNGSKVVVEMRLPLEAGSSTIMFLYNLDKDVTEQDIADHIKKHGKIETPPKSIRLCTKNRQRSQITFASNEHLIQTIRDLNGTKLKGKEVFMTWRFKQRKAKSIKLLKGRKIKVGEKKTVSKRSSKGKEGKAKSQGRTKMKKQKKKGKKGGVKKSVKV